MNNTNNEKKYGSAAKAMTIVFAMLQVIAIIAIAVSNAGQAIAASTYVDSPLLDISMLSQTPDPVSPGSYVELRFKVQNVGGKTADQYTYQLQTKYPFYLDGSDSETKSVASLDGYTTADQGAVLYWKVRIDSNAVEGNNTVRLLYWKTGDASTVYQTPPFNIRVLTQQGLLQIGSVKVQPGAVGLGENFNITLGLENLGYNRIDNVKVNAGSGNSYFTPVQSSNLKLINSIAGKTTKDITYTFFVDPSTPLRVQQLPITVDYTDKFGKQYSISTNVGVTVDSPASYFANLEDTNVYMIGQKGKVTASVSNTGQPEMDFVTLQLLPSEYYDVIGSTKSYLGNLKSDDFETGQFTIYAKKDINGSIPLSYEIMYKDSYGRKHSSNFTLYNTVYDKSEASRLGLAKGGSGIWGILIVLILIATGFFYFRSRRKSGKNRLKN